MFRYTRSALNSLGGFFSRIGDFLSSRQFSGLLFMLLLATTGAANQEVGRPRIRLIEGDDNSPENPTNDALQQIGAGDLVPKPFLPFDPQQSGIGSFKDFRDDYDSNAGDDDYDDEAAHDEEPDGLEGEKEKRAERAPKSDDLNYIPSIPASCSVGAGTFADVATSPTHDTCLVVRQNGGSIYTQAYNTKDLTPIGSPVTFSGSKFQVTHLSNGGFAIPYLIDRSTMHVKFFDALGREVNDVDVPNIDDPTVYPPSVISYSDGIFLEFTAAVGTQDVYTRVLQRMTNDGVLIGDRNGITWDLATNDYRGAISISNNIVVDIYDEELTSLHCKFIRTSDVLRSNEYIIPFGASVTAVADQSVAYGNPDEFVVVADITDSGSTSPRAVFGHGSDFFSACTFSNYAEIPGMTLGPHEVKYVGRDREGRSIFDITGRDSSANLVEVRCWYDSGSNSAQFGTPRVVTNIASGCSTVITRAGEMLRAVWDVTDQVVLRKFTCSPVKCASTPADVTQSWPPEVSSSVPITTTASVTQTTNPMSSTTTPTTSPTTPSTTEPSTGSTGHTSATDSSVPVVSAESSEQTHHSLGSDESSTPRMGWRTVAGIAGGASAALLGISGLSIWAARRGRNRANVGNEESTRSSELTENKKSVQTFTQKPATLDNITILTNAEGKVVLGAGAFGKVQKGFWRDGNVEVAVKKLSAAMRQYPEEVTAFLREIGLMMQLRHPHIVSVYGGNLKPKPYMIMEFMSGGTLTGLLETHGADLTWDVRIKYACEIASGLAFLHSRDVMHRDLKPDNVLLDEAGKAKLSDFGLAKPNASESTATKGVIGTERWAAPEVLQTGKYNMQADIYNFGIILWQLVSGEAAPFAHYQWNHEVVAAVLRGERPQIPDYCPPEIRTLIERCWAQDPAQRPTMQQVYEYLNNYAYACTLEQQGDDASAYQPCTPGSY